MSSAGSGSGSRTATHGVVAAGDPQTAEAGAKLLRMGGNAIDATIAAAFAAFVCELPLCSPLGGGVMVVERASHEKESTARDVFAFDMFARTPGLGSHAGSSSASSESRREFDAVSVSFGAASQTFHVGRASVAVPLALRGLIDVHRRFGALPLVDVLGPAIDLGRDGWVLGRGIAFVFQILIPIVMRTPECRSLFTDEATGLIALEGARLYNRDLARVLDDIRNDPSHAVDAIYMQLAREMSPENGGLITPDDVRNAHMREHAPITTTHADWRLATMPSPSTGGLLVALGLRMLEGCAERMPFLSRDHMLFVAKVQEALLGERDESFVSRCADPNAVRAMLADGRVAVAREKAKTNLLGSTTQISAIDAHGNAVALTLTSGEGSGHVLTGTGMMTNNLLGEEDLHPHGFHKDPPGKPLTTMMAPTIMSRGTDRLALGSGGSNRLRTAILQVLCGLVEHRVSPHEAVAAPRVHIEIDAASKSPRIAFESSGLSDEVVASLRAAYPTSPAVFASPNLYFGGVHLATSRSGVFEGVGDNRRGGARVVV